jgi:hypothetical protein
MQLFLVIHPVMLYGYLPVSPSVSLTLLMCSGCLAIWLSDGSNGSFDILDLHSRLELWVILVLL